MKNYRLSSYCIFTELKDTDKKYMLIHGYTGAVDIVNNAVADFLKHGGNFTEDSITFSKATFDALCKRGYLTTKTQEEEQQYVIKLAHLLHQKSKIISSSYVFLVAYDCNFRCPYCYEKNVLENNNNWTGHVFTREMVDNAYETIVKIQPEKELRPKSITLYGGEPLLAVNKDIVEYIVNRGQELGFSFFAVTNGYDLEHFEHLLGPGMIHTLQITVDGLEESHNSRRIHYKHKDTFNKIIKNIGLALDKGTNVSVRMNTDGKNFGDLKILIEKFKDLGYFDKPGKLNPYSALLFNYDRESKESPADKGLDFMGQKEFNKRHQKEEYKFACLISNKANAIKRAILEGKRLSFSSIFCSAQSGSYIFDPFGEIYTCWNEVGNKAKMIGTYRHGEPLWKPYREFWQSKNIGTSPQCSKCKFAFFCQGGCMSHNEIVRGRLQTGFCNEFSDTFSHAVNMLYADLRQEKFGNCKTCNN